jgi:ATP-dependent RNA helicase RhlE
VCVDERDFLRDIERLLKREIQKTVIAGFEPDPAIKPEPIVMGRGQRGGGRSSSQRPASNPARGQDARRGGHERRGREPQRGQRPASNAKPRPDAGHDQRGNRHPGQREVDGNRREVDGNRNAPDRPRADARGGRDKTRQSPPNRARAGQPARPRREREIPALFGGGRRDD